MIFEIFSNMAILSWDHIRINYVPVSSLTVEKEGTKKVDNAGMNDKRQITVILRALFTTTTDLCRENIQVSP